MCMCTNIWHVHVHVISLPFNIAHINYYFNASYKHKHLQYACTLLLYKYEE